MYKLLYNLLSCQSVPVPFRISINLVQLTWSNAFCQSTKQTHSSSSISKAHSDIILNIPTASIVPVPLLNLNWSPPSTSSILLSILLLIIFAVCVCIYKYLNFCIPLKNLSVCPVYVLLHSGHLADKFHCLNIYLCWFLF